MNSSYNIDISAQTSQLRPPTLQHGSTQSYQTLDRTATWAFPRPVVRDWLRSPPAQLQGTSRPPSHSELKQLAECHWQSMKRHAKTNMKPLKCWLRLAECIRRDAESFHKQGDLDSAFVEYNKASKILSEEIPAHPDYTVLLGTKHHSDLVLVSHFYPIGPHLLRFR